MSKLNVEYIYFSEGSSYLREQKYYHANYLSTTCKNMQSSVCITLQAVHVNMQTTFTYSLNKLQKHPVFCKRSAVGLYVWTFEKEKHIGLIIIEYRWLLSLNDDMDIFILGRFHYRSFFTSHFSKTIIVYSETFTYQIISTSLHLNSFINRCQMVQR